MRILKRTALGLASVGVLIAAHARAEDPAAPSAALPAEVAPAEPAPAAEAAGPRTVVLHANSYIPLRLAETISSETHATGATFALEVTENVTVDGVVVIPAGSRAEGQIIHATKSSMLGKPGELIITARFVAVGDRKVKLRSLLTGTGQSRAVVAFVIWPFVKGKQVIIPSDTELLAKVAEDETFVVPPASG